MKQLISIVASTLFSLIGAYVGLIIAVYSELDVLTAALIAFGFVIGCRFSGKLDRTKTILLSVTIVVTWIIAWFVFCPLIGEITPADAQWYYHNRNDVTADFVTISVGLVLVLFYSPNATELKE